MHAIIQLGAGKYYVSPVFGYYKDENHPMLINDIWRKSIPLIMLYKT